MTPEEFKKILDETLADHLDPITHKEHHEAIEAIILREKRKQEMWQKIKTQVLGWGIIALIGWIGSLVYKALGGD